MAANVPEVTDDTFQQEVLESQEPVVVDFWAEWCGPCKAMAPIVEQLAQENSAKIKFVKLDVETNRRVSQQYRVQGIPTLMVFKGGQRAGELVGLQPKDVVQRKLNEMLG